MPAIKSTLTTTIYLICATVVFAGDLNAPSGPTDRVSAMYTLEDIYNRMDTGATASKRTGPFVEPGLAPGSTGYNLDEVMGKAPLADNVNGVLPEGVLVGEVYWSLRTDGTWGPQVGTMPNNGVVIFSPGTADQPVDGFYSSMSKVTGDSDLTAPNIAEGVNIFNVVGTAKVATGTATDADVLATKTYSNVGGSSTGSMVNVGAQMITPGDTSKTITQGYHDGTGSVATDANLVTGNIKSGATIFGVPGKTEVVDTTTGDALPADLLSGKNAWVDGLEVTGTATAGTDVSGADGFKTFTIPNGLYTGSKTVTANDADLVSENIKSGISIFGVAGDSNVVDTTETTNAAGALDIANGQVAFVNGSEITGMGNIGPSTLVPRTGQTTCYDAAGIAVACAGTGQDGEVLAGEAWPNPRFTDNSDGTVTDNLTGLVWLKNANCFDTRNWATALSDANGLADGACGLTDGSSAGDWHLPNRNELNSLIDSEFFNPALSNAAGTAQWTTAGDAFSGVPSGVVSSYYWSSTSHAVFTLNAWMVALYDGAVLYVNKTDSFLVWPVRAGH